jgi:uncharacterized protein with GYD domain
VNNPRLLEIRRAFRSPFAVFCSKESRPALATYIVLSKYAQPSELFREGGPGQVEAARRAGRLVGVELKAWFDVSGRYDVVTIWEAPDEDSLCRALVDITSLASPLIESLRSFSEDDFLKVVSARP